MSGGPLLEVRDLSFSYGETPVLSHLSLTLPRGSFAALIGSNGAGKSTLLKLLLGELAPDAGTITLQGREGAVRGKKGPRIGYVPQDGLARHADFPASVLEIVLAELSGEIGLFRFPRAEHRQRARQALELVGMQDYEKRLIGALSGGQRQRVLLARSLVARPEVMILDEPTTGMDQPSAEQFYQLLARLNREQGMTILMVSHEIDRLCPYVDHIFSLQDRTLVSLDPKAVQARYAQPLPTLTVQEDEHGDL